MDNIFLIKTLYESFRKKDYDTVRQLCSSDIEWIQNKGFPNGAHHKGIETVIEKVFKGFANDWSSFGFEAKEYLGSDSTVTVLGHYYGQHLKTGKNFKASTAHVYNIHHGKVIRFRQYTDTQIIVASMQ